MRRSPSRVTVVESSRPSISSSDAPSNTGVATLVSGGGLCALPREVLAAHVGLALDLPALLGDPSEVGLEHLAEVHSTGDTERVQDDVDRRSVGEERHVFDRQDLRDDTLVAVTTGELVTLGDLALLGDVDDDALVDARAELVVAVLGVEHLDTR